LEADGDTATGAAPQPVGGEGLGAVELDDDGALMLVLDGDVAEGGAGAGGQWNLLAGRWLEVVLNVSGKSSALP
jgi:hypothetical protein